ncbi:DUF4304 domain-containing protein [Bacillus suaedaesalsae]|uniref:DUF4304 domain-containing protein n=1 Tax=Bacillus suaedaesalsae TaxID=2810349 RepID=A0ABS2DNC7_9BACI|nr:DUF4304 domain-containing protein [Bacillus suaedaesalsae]MBM6619979.1 DUF4304 domain-containing protein [Bacillus suaedaesalsae]
MKELLQKISPELKTFGYKKKGSNFWKIENGFYKIINFQKGLHGGQYYFINVGIHPNGMPQLISNQLLVLEQPKENECIIRQRVEQIIESKEMNAFKEGLVSLDDERTTENFIKIIPEIEKWSLQYGTYEELIGISEKEIYDLLNASPILKKKAFVFLQLFCEIKLNNKEGANEAFDKYKKENVNGLNFDELDNYLGSLIEKIN